MRKQKLRDWGRRLLIVLLLVSAALLLRRTGYYDGIRSRLGRSLAIRTERSAGADTALPHPIELMTPLAVTVRAAEGGGRFGAQYDAAQTLSVFQRFSVDLSEALGSAGAPAARTQAEFRAGMDRCCVVLHFSSPMPLELLSGWLGVEMTSAAARDAAQVLCLSAAEDEAYLSYRTEDGAYYACTTAVNTEGFRGRAAEYAPNGTLYGWESDRLADGGDFLLLPALPDAPVLQSAVPLPRGEETDALLTALGMNSFLTSSYTEYDGTVVYISDENTTRVSPSGWIFFRRAAAPETGAPEDITTAVSRACQAAEACLGRNSGDGALRFAGVTRNDAQQSFTVLLDYAVDGIPVRLASDHAAELVVRGGKVIQARMLLRQFTRTDVLSELLPALQAAAIAQRAQGRPELVYSETGGATECVWVIENG